MACSSSSVPVRPIRRGWKSRRGGNNTLTLLLHEQQVYFLCTTNGVVPKALSCVLPLRYSFNTSGLSLTGSTVTNSGWIFGRPLVLSAMQLPRVILKTHNYSLLLPMASMTFAIFSSSSGQMSGQKVNPKYRRTHWPKKSFSVFFTPLWSTKEKEPPRAALP